jgi:16S rRNA (guanine966-N2)-methyltransferase
VRIIARMKPETGQLRIIGGTWRGRKIDFVAAPGLRPTPNRVRETLFNWLAPVIRAAHCLDLFAGSGALGLEAVSRGAAGCVLVEQNPEVAALLRGQAGRLAAERVEVITADALQWLSRAPPRRFDIVFLDPPFQDALLADCLQRLDQGGWLAPTAWIYVESAPSSAPPLPAGWHWHRDRQAGQVRYRLAVRQVAAAD